MNKVLRVDDYHESVVRYKLLHTFHAIAHLKLAENTKNVLTNVTSTWASGIDTPNTGVFVMPAFQYDVYQCV